MKHAHGARAFVAVVLSFAAFTTEASADSAQECVDAADRGQRARKDGKLQDARDHFLSCAAPMCPEAVQSDCLRWANDAIELLPSIVIDATDEDGRDIGDARVTIDGYPAATVTEGRSIEIDPGVHTVRVERPGHVAVEQRIITKEGMHARRVVAVLTRSRTERAPSTSSSFSSSTEDRTKDTSPPSWTFAAMGIGAATLTAGILIVAGSAELTPGDDRELVRTLGWGSVALGSAATLGGLFGYFSEPAKPRARAGITVTPVGAFGRF